MLCTHTYIHTHTHTHRRYITGMNKHENESEAKKRSCLFDSKPNFAGFCCLIHGGEERKGLLPERSSDMKLISETQLCNLLGTQHVDSEMFPYVESSMCRVCDESFKEKVSSSKRVLDEAQDIVRLCKSSTYQNNGEPYVFVSRTFLTHFRKMYVIKLEKYHDKLIKRDPAIDKMICPKAPDGAVNESIQCEHGRIKARTMRRSLMCMPKSLFVRLETFLKQHASNHVSSVAIVKEDDDDDGLCAKCKTNNASSEKDKKMHEKIVTQALKQLPTLRRVFDTMLPDRLERSVSSCEAEGVSWLSPGVYLWIPRAWLSIWRGWMSNGKREPPTWPPPELSTCFFFLLLSISSHDLNNSQQKRGNVNTTNLSFPLILRRGYKVTYRDPGKISRTR